jgi:hypothetical protein
LGSNYPVVERALVEGDKPKEIESIPPIIPEEVFLGLFVFSLFISKIINKLEFWQGIRTG